jgi:uncharacterized membrane protein YphA (DoxX/SURF4 family)
MLDKRSLNIFSIIIGTLFVVSGIGKVVDVGGFSNLINQYGLGYLMLLSPIIILFEILLGLSLILLINPKRDAMISTVMLTVFTGLFAFAHFRYGINDCGCFGTIQNTNFPPIFSFIRNFILIGMSILLWYGYSNNKIDVDNWKKYLIASVMVVSIFFSGLTYRTPLSFRSANQEIHNFQDENIKNTELSNYLKTSSDSTYLVFCFSYTCSYCWNSIENLRSFIRNNSVDSVRVFAIGEEKDRLIFEENFKPDFPITNLSAESMDKLTLAYPTAFYIENDTVRIALQSELPSPFVFKNYLNK